MRVAKITLWNGAEYFTHKVDFESLKSFFDKARDKWQREGLEQTQDAEISILEMTEEEYFQIPATVDSAELFEKEAKK